MVKLEESIHNILLRDDVVTRIITRIDVHVLRDHHDETLLVYIIYICIYISEILKKNMQTAVDKLRTKYNSIFFLQFSQKIKCQVDILRMVNSLKNIFFKFQSI